MLQLESLNEFEWRRLIERLDKAVAEAARGYLRHLHARRVPIIPDNWDIELDELRLAREPAYDKPGLPLVYALKYMPRRVISILGSLLAVGIDRYPTSVLDVGSGPGATALALDLINAPRHMNLLGIEPSREMITFADSSRFQTRVTARYQEGSVGARSATAAGNVYNTAPSEPSSAQRSSPHGNGIHAKPNWGGYSASDRRTNAGAQRGRQGR